MVAAPENFQQWQEADIKHFLECANVSAREGLESFLQKLSAIHAPGTVDHENGVQKYELYQQEKFERYLETVLTSQPQRYLRVLQEQQEQGFSDANMGASLAITAADLVPEQVLSPHRSTRGSLEIFSAEAAMLSACPSEHTVAPAAESAPTAGFTYGESREWNWMRPTAHLTSTAAPAPFSPFSSALHLLPSSAAAATGNGAQLEPEMGRIPRIVAEFDGLITGKEFNSAKARNMDRMTCTNLARGPEGVPEIKLVCRALSRIVRHTMRKIAEGYRCGGGTLPHLDTSPRSTANRGIERSNKHTGALGLGRQR